MQNEIFKDIPNYEGIYQVSNFGVVKSLGRFSKFKDGLREVKPRILKSYFAHFYMRISLNKDGLSKKYSIHQLVAMAFLGHKPDGTTKIVVDHINNDKLDNRLDNLQLISHRKNVSKDSKGSSKYVGVHYYKRDNKWVAYITKNWKRKHLGYFKNELEASNAYQEALKNII